MKLSRILLVLTLSLVMSEMQDASADVLVMKNGDQLTGEVVTKTEDTLTFKTPYGEPFLIDWHHVQSLTSDKPMKVLSEDDFSVTETSKIDEASPYFAGKPRARKYTINPESWRLGEGTKYSGRINFSFDADRGNNDQDELGSDIFLKARNLRNRYTLQGDFENDQSEDLTTAENYTVSADYDRFLNKNLFLSALVGFEKDRFADLDQRLKYGSTVGYQVYESAKRNLSFEAGPFWVDEKFTTGEEEQFWATGWKIDYDHFLIMDRLQFYHRQDGTWNIEETDKVILDAWFGLRAPLYEGIVASTEVLIEYDSQPAAGADDTDFTYAVKLGYEWGQ